MYIYNTNNNMFIYFTVATRATLWSLRAPAASSSPTARYISIYLYLYIRCIYVYTYIHTYISMPYQ